MKKHKNRHLKRISRRIKKMTALIRQTNLRNLLIQKTGKAKNRRKEYSTAFKTGREVQ